MALEFSIVILALIVALVFVFIHLSSPRIYGFSEHHKKGILSFSGGIAAAYVFLDLLPVIQKADPYLHILFNNNFFLILFLEKAIYGVAFLGFVTFFILEYVALNSREKRSKKNMKEMEDTSASRNVFYVHLGLTALVSMIICYSIPFEIKNTGLGIVLYTIALSLHFFTSDHAMEEHYQSLYVKYGRYALAFMPLIGWGLSLLFPERESEAYVLLAFIAGAVLFNVIKDEIPRLGTGKPVFFFLGATLYSIILLLLPWIR